MAFTGVTTTGIYCRPGCGARPNAGHCRTFPTAAAAEAAGFRACFQCRPYRLGMPASWDSPELVCRGVRMILDGALDDGTEAQLASRLGVSARHLRRLFLAHVGATPDQLARSSRAHFARRLLDDTDLTISDVAFASGFGSIRQFNRIMRDTFRATPRQLRAKRRKDDRLVADGGLPLRLPLGSLFDWPASLTLLARHAVPGVERVDGRQYRRTVSIDGAPGVLEVAGGAPDHLLVTMHLPVWSGLIHLVQRVRHVFNVDLDESAAARQLAVQLHGEPIGRWSPGVRPPGAWDLFEAAVVAVLGRGLPVESARRVAGRLAVELGEPVTGLGPMGLTRLFPSAEVLADADLRDAGLEASRADDVRALAQAVSSGDLELDRHGPTGSLLRALLAVDGISADAVASIGTRLGSVAFLDRALPA